MSGKAYRPWRSGEHELGVKAGVGGNGNISWEKMLRDGRSQLAKLSVMKKVVDERLRLGSRLLRALGTGIRALRDQKAQMVEFESSMQGRLAEFDRRLAAIEGMVGIGGNVEQGLVEASGEGAVGGDKPMSKSGVVSVPTPLPFKEAMDQLHQDAA